MHGCIWLVHGDGAACAAFQYVLPYSVLSNLITCLILSNLILSFERNRNPDITPFLRFFIPKIHSTSIRQTPSSVISVKFSIGLNLSPSNVRIFRGADGCFRWKSATFHFAFSKLSADSHVLCSSVYPFHFVKYSSFPRFILESNTSSTSYSSSFPTTISGGSSAACPNMVGA